MARPRTPIGTFGDIEFTVLRTGVRARVRFRDLDGQLRRIEATGVTRKLAEHRLKERIAERSDHSPGAGELTPDSSFRQLVEVWLADLDLENKVAESTRALYERNMRQLAAEYETLAAEAQHDRFISLLARSGLTDEQLTEVVASSAIGPLAAALRRAEAHHHRLETLLPRVVAQHPLDDAEDVAAVLQYRLDNAAASIPRGCPDRARFVAGLIPEALGPMPAEHRQGLDERKALIECRAVDLATAAVEDRAPWIRRLRDVPARDSSRREWHRAVAVIAAYRDRYGITSDLPLGGPAGSDVQRNERVLAAAAVRRAQRLAGERSAPDRRAASIEPLGSN